MKWFAKFLDAHGERIIFGSMASAFALGFMYFGSEEMQGAGSTILIGVAMLCFNKARGGSLPRGNGE